MKLLKSKRMKQLLKKGILKARKRKIPGKDSFNILFDLTLKNGWHYQVDALSTGVIVYAFKPPLDFQAIPADYYLSGTIRSK